MLYAIYFIYGLCVMFYFMMSWLFYRKDKELLSRLVTVLMFVIGLQCLKDLFFIKPFAELDEIDWMIVTAADMVAVPLYAFALIELCSPTSLTRRTIVFHELLFIVPFVLLLFTRDVVFYYAMVLEAAVYGTSYAIWAAFAIPKYNAQLKQRFSYTENINLGWLRAIFFSFTFILLLWIIDCMHVSYTLEALYMVSSLVVWMFITYYIYKHESVLDELSDLAEGGSEETPAPAEASDTEMSEIGKRISTLFDKDRIFLNPNLKVSDIATEIGTNRTYVSAFFNKEAENIKTEADKKRFLEKSEKLNKKWKEKLEATAKDLNGKPIEFAESQFEVTSPVSLEFEEFSSSSALTPKFKVNGEAKAASDITIDQKYYYSTENVYITGYDAEGKQVYKARVGSVEVQDADGKLLVKAGTPVKFDKLGFGKADVEGSKLAKSYKLEMVR